MLKDVKIELFYRILCLIVFIIVILFSSKIMTLAILGLLFLVINIKKSNYFISILFILMIIGFLLALYANSFALFRISLIIGCTLYFINFSFITKKVVFTVKEKILKKKKNYSNVIRNSNIEKVDKILMKGEEIDSDDIYLSVEDKTNSDIKSFEEQEILRFVNSKEKMPEYTHKLKYNYYEMAYVIFHLVVLFGSIWVGNALFN